MHENKNRQHTEANYRQKIDTALAIPLDAKTIDSYADAAIDNVAAILNSAVEGYAHQPTIHLGEEASQREREDAALSYFGIENVDYIIEHIVKKADQLHELDSFITQIPHIDTVITPPDTDEQYVIRPGNEKPFTRAEVLPKLKTLLFIAENEFDIDIHEPDQLRISLGQTPENSVREHGYYTVKFPSIHRTVLVCDEAKNMTFVLDSSILDDAKINIDALSSMTKQSLKEYIAQNPSSGRSIPYTANYSTDIRHALHDLSTETPETSEATNYLVPPAPEHILSVKKIAAKVAVSEPVVRKAIHELGIADSGDYRFGPYTTKGYDEGIIDRIDAYLEQNGYQTAHPPEGSLSINKISSILGIDYYTASNAAAELGLQGLGSHRFGTRIAKAYSEEDMEKIRDHLKAEWHLDEPIPEGYMTIVGIYSALNAGRRAVESQISTLGIRPAGTYIIGSKKADVYSDTDIAKIARGLKDSGYATEVAPDGYLSARGIAKKFGVANSSIQKILSDNPSIQTSGLYRFGPQSTDAYDTENVEAVRKILDAQGFFSGPAPEGCSSISQIATQQNLSIHHIAKTVETLGVKPVGRFRFGHRIADAYPPESVQQIVDHATQASASRKRSIGEAATSPYA